MKNLFKASVLAALISFGSTNAFAADSEPTVSDAHELIGYLIGDGLVFELNSSNRDYVLSNYQGSGCVSSINSGLKGASVRIDWSGITSVVKEDPEKANEKVNVTITGNLQERAADGTSTDKYHKRSFYFMDEISRKRVEKAMKLLMYSCAKKKKFD